MAKAALDYVPSDTIIGVGTGSTANFFIDELSHIKTRIKGAVASSQETANRLLACGIDVFDLNDVGDIAVYIDGADEADDQLNLIKGGGGALTREKIIAAAAKRFICLVDVTKRVSVLGQFPLAVEVVPMASRYVIKMIKTQFNFQAKQRANFITDNGNVIVDIDCLSIKEPLALETALNQIAGVLSNGLFAQRKADVLLIGGDQGVITLT